MISSEEPILVYTNVVTALQLIQAIIVVSSVLVDDLVGVLIGVLVRVWRADSFSQITGIIVAKFKLIDDETIIVDGKPAFLNCSPKLIQAVVVTRKAVIRRAIFPMGDPSTSSRIGGYLYKPATTGVGVPDLMLP